MDMLGRLLGFISLGFLNLLYAWVSNGSDWNAIWVILAGAGILLLEVLIVRALISSD